MTTAADKLRADILAEVEHCKADLAETECALRFAEAMLRAHDAAVEAMREKEAAPAGSPGEPQTVNDAFRTLKRIGELLGQKGIVTNMIDMPASIEAFVVSAVAKERLRVIEECEDLAMTETPTPRAETLLFPILSGKVDDPKAWLPWELFASHEAQVKRNHGQTLQRLAARGGLSWCEALAVLEDRPWRAMPAKDACIAVLDLFAAAAERRGFKDAIDKTAPGWQDLGTALRMVEDAVQELGPVGALKRRDEGLPPAYIEDAEHIISGIQLMVAAAVAAERERVIEEFRLLLGDPRIGIPVVTVDGGLPQNAPSHPAETKHGRTYR